MRIMTLRGASEYLGISKNRIWRAVKDGHLPADEGRFKGQKALTVTQVDLDAWAQAWLTHEELGLKKASQVPQEPSKHPEEPVRDLQAPGGHPEAPQESYEAPSRRLEEVLGERFEVPQGASGSPKAVAALSLRDDLVAALERSHREIRLVERRAIELELQLRQHKLLLTENAESLQEHDARVKEAEARLQVVEATKQAELERLATELEAAQKREALARENETQLRAAEEARKTETELLKAELETTRQKLAASTQKPSGLFSWLGLRKKRTSDVTVTASKAL